MQLLSQISTALLSICLPILLNMLTDWLHLESRPSLLLYLRTRLKALTLQVA